MNILCIVSGNIEDSVERKMFQTRAKLVTVSLNQCGILWLRTIGAI